LRGSRASKLAFNYAIYVVGFSYTYLAPPLARMLTTSLSTLAR